MGEAVRRTSVAALLGDPGHGCIWFIATGRTRIGFAAPTSGISIEHGSADAFIDEDARGRGAGDRAM